jgi:hypothetical protein
MPRLLLTKRNIDGKTPYAAEGVLRDIETPSPFPGIDRLAVLRFSSFGF